MSSKSGTQTKRRLSIASTSKGVPSPKTPKANISPPNSDSNHSWHTADPGLTQDFPERQDQSSQSRSSTSSEVLWRWDESPNTQRMRTEMKSKWKMGKKLARDQIEAKRPTEAAAAKSPSVISKFKQELELLEQEDLITTANRKETVTKSISFCESESEEDELNTSWRKYKSSGNFDLVLTPKTTSQKHKRAKIQSEAVTSSSKSPPNTPLKPSVFQKKEPRSPGLSKALPFLQGTSNQTTPDQPTKLPAPRKLAPLHQKFGVAVQPKIPLGQKPAQVATTNQRLPSNVQKQNIVAKPQSNPQKPQGLQPSSSTLLQNSMANFGLKNPKKPEIPQTLNPQPAKPQHKVQSIPPKPAPAILDIPGFDSDDSFDDAISSIQIPTMSKTMVEEPPKAELERHQSMPAKAPLARACTPQEIEEKRQKAIEIQRQKQALRRQQNGSR